MRTPTTRLQYGAGERQIAGLLKELAQLRYELARRDMLDVFANAPSPSVMMQ